MIRKLRYQLVAAAMVSLFLVLSIIIGSASFISYQRIINTADQTLQILKDNDGRFPELQEPEKSDSFNTDLPDNADGTDNPPQQSDVPGKPENPEAPGDKMENPPQAPAADSEDTIPEPPAAGTAAENPGNGSEPGGENPGNPGNNTPQIQKQDRFSKELPFESRYFSIFLSEDGSVNSVNVGRVAAVDEDTAVEYGNIVFQKGNGKGFLSDYRYIMYTEGDEIRIIFLDCGRTLDNFRSFIQSCSLIAILGLLAVFAILLSLSHRIVKPFAESYQKQRQFITDAGHELKTPLTIINADAEILEMDFGENEWLSDIQGQTKRLTELTNHLILLSRMEEDQPKSEMMPFSFSECAEDVVDSFQALAKTQEKTLEAQIQSDITINGDRGALQRLITILLDNAMKYTNPNGQISLSLEKQKSHVKLCVYNSCEHISKENTAHLFDRFYRTDSSRNSKTGGFGLGLSIASATVKAHKGKISAETADEKSLSITVLLPL